MIDDACEDTCDMGSDEDADTFDLCSAAGAPFSAGAGMAGGLRFACAGSFIEYCGGMTSSMLSMLSFTLSSSAADVWVSADASRSTDAFASDTSLSILAES
jgi:hypothetical protein